LQIYSFLKTMKKMGRDWDGFYEIFMAKKWNWKFFCGLARHKIGFLKVAIKCTGKKLFFTETGHRNGNGLKYDVHFVEYQA